MKIRGIIIALILLSVSMLVNGISVSAAPTVWTVGTGGDFNNVSQALSSGMVNDGDVLLFVSDVSDYWGVVIDINLTIDGDGHIWTLINNTPGENTGVYVVDRVGGPTSFILMNISMVTASQNLTQFIYTNASAFNMTGVSFLYLTSSYPYSSAVKGEFISKSVNFWATNVYDNGSLIDAIYLNVSGASNGDVTVQNFYSVPVVYLGGGDIYVWVSDTSVLTFYGSNLFFNNVGYGLYLRSGASSELNVFLEDVTVGYVDRDGIFVYMSGDDGQIDVANVWIWNASGSGIDITDYTSYGAPVTLINIFVNYSFYQALGVDLSSSSDAALLVENVTILWVDDYGIDVNAEPDGDFNVSLSNIFINYSLFDSINIDDYGTSDSYVIIKDIFINYSDDDGIDYYNGGYGWDVYLNITDVSMNYVDWDALDISGSAYDDAYVNISRIYCVTADDDFIEYSLDADDDEYLLMYDLFVNETDDEGIDASIVTGYYLYLNISNVYFGYTEDDSVYLDLYPWDDTFINISGVYVNHSDWGAIYIYLPWDYAWDLHLILEDIYVGYSYDEAIELDLEPYDDFYFNITDIYVGYSDDYGIYLEAYPGGDIDGTIDGIYVNYTYYAAIEMYFESDYDISLNMDTVVINYSDDWAFYLYATSYYLDSVAINLANIIINGSYYEAVYLEVEADGGYVNLSNVSLGYCGLGGTSSIYFDIGGSNTTYSLNNVIINNSGGGAIEIYVDSTDTYVELSNVYINSSEGDAIKIRGPTPRLIVPVSGVAPYQVSSDQNNNISLSNVYVGRLSSDNWNSLYISNGSGYLRRIDVYHSVFLNPISLEDVNNALFSETYFNESAAILNNSRIGVKWTLGIKVLSMATGLPVPDVIITLYNDSSQLATGRTGSDGSFNYVLSYNITDTIRTAPYLSVVGVIDSSYAVWNNTGGFTLPKWFVIVEMNINYTLLRITGLSSRGLSSLSVSGNSGELVVFWYFDPIDPARNRVERYPIRIVGMHESNDVMIFDILVSVRVAGRDVWLPGRLIIDNNVGTVLLTGPVTLFAKI